MRFLIDQHRLQAIHLRIHNTLFGDYKHTPKITDSYYITLLITHLCHSILYDVANRTFTFVEVKKLNDLHQLSKLLVAYLTETKDIQPTLNVELSDVAIEFFQLWRTTPQIPYL